jgi:arabinogalactan oligomer / maltooligosaccharide transport system substrate-binding protein
VIWHEFDGPGDTSKSVLDEICADYTERLGVKVTPEVMNIEELIDRLKSVKKSGVGPHMAFTPSDMAGMAEVALYSQTPSGLFRDKLSEASLSTMRMNGAQYGVPILLGNHLVMFFNRDIFPEAPQTWEQLEQAVQRLSQRSVVPIGADLRHPYWFIPFLTAFGGWPIQGAEPNLGTAEMRRALSFVRTGLQTGVIASFDGSTSLLDKFFAGGIGAIICGEWIFNYVDQHMKEKLGVGGLPAIRGVRPVPMTSSVGLVFPNRALESEYRDDLLAFAEYMLSDECQRKWAQQVHRLPASEAILNDVMSTSSANKREIVAQLRNCRPIPVHAKMSSIWEAMKAGLDVLVNRGGTPEEALSCMVQQTAAVADS